MKEFPQCHFVQFPVTVLELLGSKTVTRTNEEPQQNRAFVPSYIRWNCLLISSYHRGDAEKLRRAELTKLERVVSQFESNCP